MTIAASKQEKSANEDTVEDQGNGMDESTTTINDTEYRTH